MIAKQDLERHCKQESILNSHKLLKLKCALMFSFAMQAYLACVRWKHTVEAKRSILAEHQLVRRDEPNTNTSGADLLARKQRPNLTNRERGWGIAGIGSIAAL